LEVQPTVMLLYGPQWTAVTDLLPLAAAQVTLGGLGAAAYGLLLANNRIRICLTIDLLAAALGVLLAIILIPAGAKVYLAGLGVHSGILLITAVFMLVLTRGITWHGVLLAILPPCLAAAA